MDQFDPTEFQGDLPKAPEGFSLKEATLVMIGEEGTGKTTIFNNARNTPTQELQHTTEVDIWKVPNDRTSGLPFEFTLKEIPGTNEFFGNVPSHIRDATVVWLFYDITRKETFDNLPRWIRLTNIYAPNALVFLIGNKLDLVEQDESKRQVTREMASKVAARHKYHFYENGNSNARIFEFIIMKTIKSIVLDPRHITGYKKQSTYAQHDSGVWNEEMYRLIEAFADTKLNGYGLYTPMVKYTAPNLLKKEVQDKIQELKVDRSALQAVLVWVHFMQRNFAKPKELLQMLQVACIIGIHELKLDLIREVVKNVEADNVFEIINLANSIKFENTSDRTLLMECLFETANWCKSETDIAEHLHDKIFAEFNEYKNKNLVPQMESEMDKLSDPNAWFQICAKLYEERDTTGDLTVNIGLESMKVHKLIVARRCDYFKTVLTSRFREHSQSHVTLEISNDVTLQAFELVMRYLYTNDPTHITDPNDCLTVTGLAAYLMLTSATKSSVDHSGLLNHCENTTVESISIDNCIELVGQAYQDKDDEVLRLSTNFVVEHYMEIVKKYENEFVKLPKGLMFVVMNKVLFNVIKAKRSK